MSAVKEPFFYMTDGPPPKSGGPGDNQTYGNYVWVRSEYERLFESAPPGMLRGECTPYYLSSFRAHEKMASEVPRAKLIAVLRDPVRRAYSHWRYMLANGQETITNFLAACDAGDARLRRGWAPDWGYLQIGLYGKQLLHLRQYFPSEQLLLLNYESLSENPALELTRMWSFLGVCDPGSALPWENATPAVAGGLKGKLLGTALRAGFRVRRAVPAELRHTVSARVYDLYRSPLGENAQGQRLEPSEAAQLREYFICDAAVLSDAFGLDVAGWISKCD